MKKTALLLALLLAAMAALSGCGGNAAVDDGSEYQIKWYSKGTESTDHDLVFEKISEMTMEKINASVTQTLIPNAEYAEKIQLLIASGEDMDMLFAANFTNYAADGSYYSLGELLKSNGQGILEVMPDYAWDAVTYKNEIYAVPSLKDYPTHHVMWYFGGLAEKYNMDFSGVTKLEDLEPMLQTIKDNEPGIVPLATNATVTPLDKFLPFEKITGSVVAAFDSEDYSNIVNIYETEEMKAFFDLMRSWNQKGFFRDDAATITSSQDLIKAGKTFMDYGASIPYYEEQLAVGVEPGMERKFIYTMAKPFTDTSSILGSVQAIYYNSKNPARTMDFMNLLHTDADLMNLVVYGIEGQHYTADGETHLKYPEGVARQSDNDYYNSAAYQGNRFLLRLQEGDPADLWQQYQAFNDEAEVSPAIGFTFDNTPVVNEITAINNVWSEYIPTLLVGAADPAELLPAALEKFKVAGSDKVVEEVKAQYTAWLEETGK